MAKIRITFVTIMASYHPYSHHGPQKIKKSEEKQE